VEPEIQALWNRVKLQEMIDNLRNALEIAEALGFAWLVVDIEAAIDNFLLENEELGLS
jgi:hypothetical protein